MTDADRQPDPSPARPTARPTDPSPARAGSRRHTSGPVQYKGGDLDAERGPGLGCFWFQVSLLGVLIVLTPVSVSLNWPSEVSAVLLFVVIGLTLLTGQTIIFLLRLVAADRRSRRRPLASATKTVGELEDDRRPTAGSPARDAAAPPNDAAAPPNDAAAPPNDAAAPPNDAAATTHDAEEPRSDGTGDVRQ